MGLLDDAIREHLELKRKRGADPGEVERQEREVLGAREQAEFAPTPEAASPEAEEPVAAAADPDDAGEEREPFADEVVEPAPADEESAEPAGAEPFDVEALEPRAPAPEAAAPETDPWLEEERDEVPAEESLAHPGEPGEEPAEDVLEDTPEFLQETPEHDRLWFEQRPPRDFDWDK
jgi:hypothetical protein